MLRNHIDALEAEEQQLAQEPVCDPSESISAAEVAQWAERLPNLLTAGSAQQRKALLRKLIKEIRVMSRDEVVPTYRIPPLVRAVSGSVGGADRSLLELATGAGGRTQIVARQSLCVGGHLRVKWDQLWDLGADDGPDTRDRLG